MFDETMHVDRRRCRVAKFNWATWTRLMRDLKKLQSDPPQGPRAAGATGAAGAAGAAGGWAIRSFDGHSDDTFGLCLEMWQGILRSTASFWGRN